MSTSTTTFDIARFSRAFAERDAAAQIEAYAPEATVTIADPTTQPSAPRVLRGRDAIAAWVEDIATRELTHAVKHAVQDDDGAAYVIGCSYPDGSKVMCASAIKLERGLISEQTVVQVWDQS
jgi:SnoaL-like domain